MSQPIRGWGRAAILSFRSARKNKNLAWDVEILLPVKFHWIPFSGYRWEIENVPDNQRPWRLSCFFFSIGRKNTNLVEDFEILLPVKFRWILLSGFRGEVKNNSDNQRSGHLVFTDPPPQKKVEKTIFSFKVKVKVTRSLTLVSFERASLVEYACQIWSLYHLRFKSYSEG